MNPDIQRLDHETVIWRAYDPSVKVELFSTAILTAAGVYLIDPIPLDEGRLTALAGGSPVAGVIVTNENHTRAAAAVARVFSTRIFAHGDLGGAESPPGLTSIRIEGAAPGEIALHCARGGGTLILGDALIHMGSHGFTFLPANYCTAPKQMRKSLRQLLDFEFERILFAHGEPIVTRAKEQLAELLTHG